MPGPCAVSRETHSVLSRIVELLNRASVPFMVAGSFASTYHGIPRTTNDIDIVIAPTEEALALFLRELPEQDYYVSQDAAFDALRRRTMFNVIDMETGWKVDMIVQKGRPFSQEEFHRRISEVGMEGVDVRTVQRQSAGVGLVG
jgi:hypothetical protein